MFDRMETTDDHGMVIVGSAVDQNGNPYYKVKNSWGTDGHIYDGYFYVSVPYFLARHFLSVSTKRCSFGDRQEVRPEIISHNKF